MCMYVRVVPGPQARHFDRWQHAHATIYARNTRTQLTWASHTCVYVCMRVVSVCVCVCIDVCIRMCIPILPSPRHKMSHMRRGSTGTFFVHMFHRPDTVNWSWCIECMTRARSMCCRIVLWHVDVQLLCLFSWELHYIIYVYFLCVCVCVRVYSYVYVCMSLSVSTQ